MARRKRATYVASTIEAGCHFCNGEQPLWTNSFAQAMAARHHDATGHRTWTNIETHVRYGTTLVGPVPDKVQFRSDRSVGGGGGGSGSAMKPPQSPTEWDQALSKLGHTRVERGHGGGRRRGKR